MAMAGEILQLDVTVNGEDPDDDVMKIFEKIRPGWKRTDLKRKTLGEDTAMVNKMYVYYITESCDDAIVVRIYGTDYAEFSNRDRERKVTLLLAEVGAAPKVYCTFKNGMCSAFVKGKTYNLRDKEGYSCKKLALAVAKELACIHCKKTAQLATDKYGIPQEVETAIAEARSILRSWDSGIDQLDPLIISTEFPTKEQFMEEWDRCEKIVQDIGMPVVMTHNDIHPANAIFDHVTDKCVVVDFEYSCFNYQGWDLAQYLYTSAVGLALDEESQELHHSDYKKDFLRSYLVSLSCHDNWSRKVTDDDVADLLGKVDKVLMLVMVVQIPIFLLIAKKPPENFGVNTNWCRGALNHWKLYLATRKDILGF